MAFDTSQLAPEEKDQLLQLLLSAQGGATEAPMEESMEAGNPDAAQDQTLIQQMIAEAIGPLREQIELLTQIVDDEIIGGVTTLYQSQQKMSEIQRLQEQYGNDEMFGPDMQSFYKDATDGKDLFEMLHSDLSDAKSSTPDWSDDMEGPLIQKLHGGLKEKMLKLRGASAPAPVAVETTEVKAEPVASSKMDDVVKKIRDMKKAGKQPKSY